MDFICNNILNGTIFEKKEDVLDILNIILIVSICIVLYFLIKFIFNQPAREVKSAAMKKSEIISGYEKRMRELLSSSVGEDHALIEKKKELLKQISVELSTNIFFDKEEVKNIIQKLVNMH